MLNLRTFRGFTIENTLDFLSFYKNPMTFKKHHIAALLSCTFGALFGQNPIPNAGFNLWNTKTYEVPQKWITIGKVDKELSKTIGNVNGLKLTNEVATGTVSFALNIGGGYPDKLNGGFAVSGTPASIKINYNSESLGTDTALVIIGFTRGNDPIPMVLSEFTITKDAAGTGDNGVTLPLNYSHPTTGLVADSGFIYISSSLRRLAPNSNGSITIYDISFPGGQTSVNGNLNIESWGSLLVRKPDQWMTSLDAYEEKVGKMNGLQEYILSSTQSRTGLAALLAQRNIVTANGIENIPAWIITKDSLLESADMGTPSFSVNQRYNSIRGYWKGALSTGDRATVMVNFFHTDTLVGSGMFTQDSKNTIPGNYMMFAENIVWDSRFTLTPTKATVGAFLTDSTFQQASQASSQIWLEDLWLDQNFASAELPNKQQNSTTVRCYPNPSVGKITLETSQLIRSIRVIGTSGQLLKTINHVNANAYQLDLSELGSIGFSVYYIRIEGDDFVSTQGVAVQKH